MAGYSVLIKRSAEKEVARLPPDARQRVVRRIRALAQDPRPQGCEKLSARDSYRLRIGSYRIVYTIEDRQLVVQVVRVAHRREVYR